jgi:hypothetical protein
LAVGAVGAVGADFSDRADRADRAEPADRADRAEPTDRADRADPADRTDATSSSVSVVPGIGVPSLSGLASTSRNAVSHALAVSSDRAGFFPRFGGI